MTWTRLPLLVLAPVLFACTPPGFSRPAPFRLRPDSVDSGQLEGPFDGRVVDAETDRPVKGALVQATWTFVQGTGFVVPSGYREWTGTTDVNGRYAVPRLAQIPRGARLSSFRLAVVKKGYVAYRSDRRFDDMGPGHAFAQRHNVVALDRWRSDISHMRHLRYAGGGATMAALTAWETEDAAAELSGAPRAASARRPAPLDVTVPPVRAATLLVPDEVKAVTRFEGDFEPAQLGDQPPSAEYDTVHLKARDLPEVFDLALRLWFLDPASAQARYGALMQDLPNVEEKNELGDRSFRALSEGKDIRALGFLDGKRGIVVMLTCGTSQCPTFETVLELAHRVRERLDAQLGVSP